MVAPLNDIHPQALVAGSARLGRGNRVQAGAIIEDGVELGDDNLILPYAIVKTGTRMGNGNAVHEHAVLGGAPQDLSFNGSSTTLEIGDGNVFREGVTISCGCKGEGCTRIGHRNYLMASVHVGHDCQLGNDIVMANGVLLAGHVDIEDRAFISGAVLVHQFCRIGCLAMLSGGTRVGLDAPPFFITEGFAARVRGLNLVGLKRAGLRPAEISAIKNAYRVLFRARRPLAEILAELSVSDEMHVRHLYEFLSASRRGFCRGEL
ncbi:MAG: acyl-ACP--UDP-N-acetylglucosamine O-acyltransferase [Chromatiales bacterium]|nr:acyl-ACP--UDP-N-acetylglucosamine O-acyltransferase [Chromatiales bacterium]